MSFKFNLSFRFLFISLLYALISGLFIGVFAKTIIDFCLQYFGEAGDSSFLYLSVIGTFIGLFVVAINMIICNFGEGKITPKNLPLLQFILVFTVCIISFFSLLFFEKNSVISLIFLSFLYSFLIYIGFFVGFDLSKRLNLKIIYGILGGGIGGLFSSIFICELYLLVINSSIDEGYFLLLTVLLLLFGFISGLLISLLFILFSNYSYSSFRHNRFTSIRFPSVTAATLLIFVILTGVSVHNYWDNLSLDDEIFNTEHVQPFSYSTLDVNETNNDYVNSIETKEKITLLLEGQENKTIDMYASLYLLSGNELWATKFKELLLEEAKERKFVGYSGSVKFWQYQTMYRAYYYQKICQINPQLFNDSEQKVITEWFKDLNSQMYKTTWVDYIYGFLFKEGPHGDYSNQEIGMGLLSILSEVLDKDYPEIAQKNLKYVDNFGVGWKYNFRNPDDGIVYHQHIWIKNAYIMAKYAGQSSYLLSNNSINSFEWILLQWPPSGVSPAYNIQLEYTPLDIMVLGSEIHQDGRYLWLANRMLSYELENHSKRNIDFTLGLDFYNESIIPVQPDIGSCYISGSTGTARNPSNLKPDKIVFRNGWEYDSLYALLNLRFSGWHSYKATNSIICIIYGEPFIVEGLSYERHSWLPKGKADHRDKKIDRTCLNTLQIEKSGFDKIIYKVTGFGSIWCQDPPRFADVMAFNTTPLADYSITKVSNWHGWNHSRATVLVKDSDLPFIAVFDYVAGDSPRQVEVLWHLKGNAVIKDEEIFLNQGNYNMTVFSPNLESWYSREILNEESSPESCDIHNPDLSLRMLSKNKSETGFITLFFPGNEEHEVKVLGDNKSLIQHIIVINNSCRYEFVVDFSNNKISVSKV